MRAMITDLADYYSAGTSHQPLMIRILELIPPAQRPRATTGKPAGKPADTPAPINLGVYTLVTDICVQAARDEQTLRAVRGSADQPRDYLGTIRALADHADAIGYQHPAVQIVVTHVTHWHQQVLRHVGDGLRGGRYITTDVLAERLERSEHAAYMWCTRNGIRPVGLAPRGHAEGGTRVAVWDWRQIHQHRERKRAQSAESLSTA